MLLNRSSIVLKTSPFKVCFRTIKLSLPLRESRFEGENDYSNVTDHIRQKLQCRLLHQENHPLQIIKEKIFDFFKNDYKCTIPGHENHQFEFFDDLNPVVTVQDNFEALLTPLDHPTRQKDESYYINEDKLLRCHMTAHQRGLLSGSDRHALLFAGDVYRRDTVDSTHYPVR